MHFEILVEDVSGKEAIERLLPKILGTDHSWHIHPYKGIGRIRKGLTRKSRPYGKTLLDNLPRVLQGYGKTYQNQPGVAVIVVCDLDDRCLVSFRNDLLAVLQGCDPAPKARFCIAVEESEAWLLGDLHAVRAAYPKAKTAPLENYVQDSICGTWEVLADALYRDGAVALKRRGFQACGTEKSIWARTITPHMDVTRNQSPSFIYFRDTLLGLATSD